MCEAHVFYVYRAQLKKFVKQNAEKPKKPIHIVITCNVLTYWNLLKNLKKKSITYAVENSLSQSHTQSYFTC